MKEIICLEEIANEEKEIKSIHEYVVVDVHK